MPFTRFQGLSKVVNWYYSDAENALLAKEGDVSESADKLEDWVREAPAVRGLLKELEAIKSTALSQGAYAATSRRLDEMARELREARAQALAERGRQRPDAGPFSNRMAHDLINEVQTFLETPGEPRVKAVVNVRERLEGVGKQDPAFVDEVAKSIQAHAKEFRREMARQAKVIWVYTVDGVLTIGTFTKHSVLAAGTHVKAAGTARLLLPPDEGRDHYFDALTAKARVEELEARLEVITAENQRRDVLANLDYYRAEAKQHEEKANARGFDISKLESDPEAGTVMVDFNSGHYHPRQAYKATHEAWEALGYKVVWDPQSTFT